MSDDQEAALQRRVEKLERDMDTLREEIIEQHLGSIARVLRGLREDVDELKREKSRGE